ncbi:hypothetical protein [uncultured Rheinheimera sp.]|jgi:hypothetical protein|uniref:hypothetical protein n=1 Tax=uncultured Rheinheimera sp. TaxID=400532 RepID=UPI00259985F7|nr:hypothetical protein [uncultured Rheinheimera sp.]
MEISKIIEELWSGDKAIGYFIHESKHYWIIDYKYNFCLDGEVEFNAYLKKGRITVEQYNAACASFRGGFLKLKKDNFLDYIYSGVVKLSSSVELSFIFRSGVSDDFFEVVSGDFLLNNVCNKQLVSMYEDLLPRLPMFYINFDMKQYFHSEFDRSHEDSCYMDWDCRFNHFLDLIPDQDAYWRMKPKTK